MPTKKAPVEKTSFPQIKNYVAMVKFEDLSVFDSVVFAYVTFTHSNWAIKTKQIEECIYRT